MGHPKMILLLFIVIFSVAHGDKSVILKGDHGDPKYDKMLVQTEKPPGDDAKSLAKSIREEIQQIKLTPINREKSSKLISEVTQLKQNLLESGPALAFSKGLDELLKETSPIKSVDVRLSPILKAEEAIVDPSINVIDAHVSQVTSESHSKDEFLPDPDEMKWIAKQNIETGSSFENLYRENLHIESIHEETDFVLGAGVEEWKVLKLSLEQTALVGRTLNGIQVAIGHNSTYQMIKSLMFDVPIDSVLLVHTLRVFDSKLNRVRNLILVAVQGQLIWHELLNYDVKEIFRWNLLNEINSMIHFTHDRNEILLLSTIDNNSGKVQIQFIEFNVPDSEFWVIQAFNLPVLPISMAHIDIGKDLIVAFVQMNKVLIYRYQFTKHLRGKFTLFKTLTANNVSTVSGFRIGGHSYLAIGGDEPQILRYSNGDFFKQTILSQSFGKVEKFLPITIRTYRDDLILLVQHRLNIETHSIPVVDALIWNGIAFDSALSVPCVISADPNANGFTCMLDLEREEGLLGAAFIHDDKLRRLNIIIPRHEVHSGMFRVNYEIVEAEDPLMKEMQQMRKSIELINKMLDYESLVKKDVEDALAKVVNPKNDFRFEDLQQIEEIDTDLLELDGNVELENDVVEFLGSTWSQEDFLVNLDEIEKTISADEQKLKAIDEELNKLNRINRQTEPQPGNIPDSKIRNFGVHSFNGQLDLKTLRVLPKDPPSHRTRRQTEPIKESRVKFLTVRNIEVQRINGKSVDELVFLENGQLVMPDGNITFKGSVEAENVNLPNDGKINGVDFSNEVLAVESPNPASELAFEDVFVQNLEVESVNGFPVSIESLRKVEIPSDILPNITSTNVAISRDLNVETINGINWNEFVAKLVPKHLPSGSAIDELKVNGDVWIADNGQLNAKSLNGLPFPEDYVLRAGERETIITGKKNFVGEVVTNAIDTEGTIDGIAPVNMITLDQPQSIPGETTFKVLEVIKKLEVNGTIAGQHLDEFLPNPSLEETKEVLAACSFKELIVEGTVTIENSLNGENLESVLSDVVYESPDEPEVIITGPKTFTDLVVAGDVNVANNFINDVNLDNIMMTDREQTVNFGSIGGDIFFTDLKILGLFDGINATELERNSVRTFGDQFIETPLIISEAHRAEATSVNIKEFLNGISVSNFLFIDQPINSATFKEVIFNDLQVENLKVSGDIAGPGALENFNVADFSSNYLSKSRVQKISVPTNIKALTTNGTFDSEKVNDIDFNVFKKYMRGIKNFKSFILSGEQKFNKLIIEGNVNVKEINGKDFNQIVENAIWLNQPNTINSNLKFLDDVVVDGDLTVNNVNQKPFKAWSDNWISKQETSIKLQADRVFKKDVIVEEALVTEIINNIKFKNLLMLDDVVQLSACNIQGNINAEKLFVERDFNRIPVKALNELYSFDAATDTHNVFSVVHFNHPTVVYYLNTPMMNHVNVSRWMNNMIRTNESKVYIEGEKVFTNDFVAQEGIFSESINDIKMNFLDQVVLINDQGLVNFEGDLVFADEVYAQLVSSKGNLFTRFISNCDTLEWLHYALPIDRDLLLNEALHIKSSALKTTNLTGNHLNGVPIESFFTLHTNQTINHMIKVFGSVEVKEPLIVKGLVNGLNILHERENTVMKNAKNQVVTVKTSLSGARVLGSLTTLGKVNSKNLQDIVLLDSSPTIESAINFRSLDGTSLYTNSLISRTNFDKWYENLLWKRGKEEQTVSAEWNVKKLRLVGDCTGNGLINDMPINEIETNLKSNINTIDVAISNHTDRYQELCKILRNKADKSRNSIHILKHFELDFKIQENEEILTLFTFQSSPTENFLALNTNCTTQLYKWKKDIGRFKKLETVLTGIVRDWVSVKTVKGDVFVITSSKVEENNHCSFGGLNVWKMNGDQIFHVNAILTEADVLEVYASPHHPGRFFTLNNLNTVEHYDVFGEKKELWKLPVESYNYSFVPSELTTDLTIYNGRKLFMLDSKFLKRQTRYLFSNAPMLQFSKLRGPSSGDSSVYNLRLPQPRPINFGQLSIPSIPAKSFRTEESENKSFVSKVKQVGEAVRKSISETFSNVQKLTIRNASVAVGNREATSASESIKKKTPMLNISRSGKIKNENRQAGVVEAVENSPEEAKVGTLNPTIPQYSIGLHEESAHDQKAQAKAIETVTKLHQGLSDLKPKVDSETQNEPRAESPNERVPQYSIGLNEESAHDQKTQAKAIETVKKLHQGLDDLKPKVDSTQKEPQVESPNERVPQYSIGLHEESAHDQKAQTKAIETVKKLLQGLDDLKPKVDSETQNEPQVESPNERVPQYSIGLNEESAHDQKAQTKAIETVKKLHQGFGDLKPEAEHEVPDESSSTVRIAHEHEASDTSLPSKTTQQAEKLLEETADVEKVTTKPFVKKHHYKLGGKQSEPEVGARSNETEKETVSFVDKLRTIVNGIKKAFNTTVGDIKQIDTKKQPEGNGNEGPDLKSNEKSEIILSTEDMKEAETDLQEPKETTRFPEVLPTEDVGEEQQVPVEVLTGSGLRETENPFFPEPGAGELVMMYVGPKNQKRSVFAVTRTRESVIKGNHNIIEIYNDIFEGSIYQYIPCSDPSNLVTLHFSDETLFAFLESLSEIQVYTYRGIQGFVPFKRIKLPGYALQMTTLTLPPKADYKCGLHYLVVRMETEVIFYVMKISGNCGLSDIQC